MHTSRNMLRSFVPLALLIGSTLANSALFPRQTLSDCTTSCLTTWEQGTTCPSTTDQTETIKCFCTDTSPARSTFNKCMTSCPTTEQQAVVKICSAAGTGGGTVATSSKSLAAAPTTLAGSNSTTTPTKTISGASPSSTLDACANKCIDTYKSETTCDIQDSTCVCSDTGSTAGKNLFACVKACPAVDQQYFVSVYKEECGTAVTAPSTSTPTGTSTPYASTTKSSTKSTSSTPATATNVAAPGAAVNGGSFVAMVGGVLAAVLAL